MNIKNCRLCGRIFNYTLGPIMCQVCRETMEAKFQEVKDFIREHPGVTIPEVSETCGVEASQIRQWLRDERLELSEDSPIYLNCDGCGMPIRCGKYCDKCKYETARGFNSMIRQNKPVEQPKKQDKSVSHKMRYL